MCGFLGEVNFINKISDKSKFINAAKILNHRGPDNFSYFTDERNLQLGFNRLAIFDTSINGNQPMNSICGRYTIVFNGAIYNFNNIFSIIKDEFTWKSKSDTEVLLNAWIKWGPSSLEKINGMFAFAIWDKKLKKIFLSRDRIGEKPLYYFHDDSYIAFSSRPKPLIKLLPKKLGKYDFSSIYYYLQAGHFPRNQSCFSKIKKLEPGKFIEFSEKGIFNHKYWDLNNYKPINNERPKTIEKQLIDVENLLKNSIKKRLLSDRPVGFFLSGGIDSSLIVSIASKIKEKNEINAFNLGFENSKYDESNDAKLVSNVTGINLIEKKLSPNELIKNIDKIYEKFDEPFADPACFPLMEISNFAKSFVDVVITGDGGDELFGGYEYYRITKIFNDLKFSKISKIFTKILMMINKSHKFHLLHEAAKISEPIKFYSFLRSYIKDFPSVINNDEEINNKKTIFSEFKLSLEEINDKKISIDQIMKIDIMHVLNDCYLQKTDLSTMAFGIESRAPFLCKDLVEWSLKLSSKYKVNYFNKKIILRELAKKYLPRQLILKKKKGFEMPLKEWLRNELYSWSKELISDRNNYQNLPLDKEKVENIFKIHQSKKRDCHPYLWSILMLLEFNKKI